MNTIKIIFSTISIMLFLEGLFLTIFSRNIQKNIKKMFKNAENLVKIGLIEIILALLIIFIIIQNGI